MAEILIRWKTGPGGMHTPYYIECAFDTNGSIWGRSKSGYWDILWCIGQSVRRLREVVSL
jgi:hypothetical protein